MLRRLYQWTLSKAAHPRAELWLAFLAFADGGLFPFPPHPLLALMCLSQPKRAVRFAAVTTIGSVLGGTFGYLLGHFLYDTIGTQLLSALGLGAKFPVAACYLRAYGVEIILLKGATPIPFLLLTITAGFVNFPLWKFVAASLVARGAIFFTLGTLFRVFGPPIKAFIEKYFALVMAAALIMLVSGYAAVSLLAGGPTTVHDQCAGATMADVHRG